MNYQLTVIAEGHAWWVCIFEREIPARNGTNQVQHLFTGLGGSFFVTYGKKEANTASLLFLTACQASTSGIA